MNQHILATEQLSADAANNAADQNQQPDEGAGEIDALLSFSLGEEVEQLEEQQLQEQARQKQEAIDALRAEITEKSETLQKISPVLQQRDKEIGALRVLIKGLEISPEKNADALAVRRTALAKVMANKQRLQAIAAQYNTQLPQMRRELARLEGKSNLFYLMPVGLKKPDDGPTFPANCLYTYALEYAESDSEDFAWPEVNTKEVMQDDQVVDTKHYCAFHKGARCCDGVTEVNRWVVESTTLYGICRKLTAVFLDVNTKKYGLRDGQNGNFRLLYAHWEKALELLDKNQERLDRQRQYMESKALDSMWTQDDANDDRPAGNGKTARDEQKLLEKYGSLEAAEARWKEEKKKISQRGPEGRKGDQGSSGKKGKGGGGKQQKGNKKGR